MDILPIHFRVFQFCGAWREHKDRNLIIHILSICYRYTVFFIIYHFTISEIIELFHMRNDIEDLTAGLCFALTFTAKCLKYINFLMRECELRNLLDAFRSKLCRPRNIAEELILKRYGDKAKRDICVFMLVCEIANTIKLITPLFDKKDRNFPFRIYVPYSTMSLYPYVFTYLLQVAAMFYGVLLNVTFDSLVYGLILNTCGQIDILCYRLTEKFRNFQENDEEKRDDAENSAIAECVKHHILVYNIIRKIQSLFMWTIVFLFFASLVTLCTSIYQMSINEFFSPDFVQLIPYLISMLIQLFLYCWYGNELDLKNKGITTIIYTSNWIILSPEHRKSLLFLMMMSQKGKVITFFGIFTLSVNSFTWIIKMSYSLFNLLQRGLD